jgi:hypothetical protein
MQNPYNTINDALKQLYTYASDINDWMIIKKELLKILPSELRKNFSTRDPLTKEQKINAFDIQIAKIWSDMINKPVVFKNEIISTK